MRGLYKANRIAVLVSGGLDSAGLVGDLAGRYSAVYPLYIRQGLAWEGVEIYWLRRYLASLRNRRVLPAGRQVRPLHILSLPMEDVYGDHWSINGKAVPGYRSDDRAVYLPGRTLVF